ncbi:YhcN/YlaJ family sporulation lipoprotein [Peribacillus alkalitolerans]|uniref:YhcN/YlaJ family sporulation lipoprotein n=1 Tax=Peribacillus alkalitolerans TaxID=1550385 RepID=UPI0013D84606|nr:YhcN/YlaJ family sporulation lipoprotein [Peribacillus alkalitolerans]
MIKKSFIVIGISSIVALTACSNRMAEEDFRNSVSPAKVSSPSQVYDEDYRGVNTDQEDFGFIRLQKTSVDNKMTNTMTPGIDREQLADVITRLSLQLPNIDDVSTLVTDEEVLVVYDTHANNRVESADQVKKTAMSVVPRYYHVYVSDNPALSQYIENYSTLETDSPNVQSMIDKTIKEMKKSPQGRDVGNYEDENGAQQGEKMNMTK